MGTPTQRRLTKLHRMQTRRRLRRGRWNTGFPVVTTRGNNEIRFELLVSAAAPGGRRSVREAYTFAQDGAVWKDASTFRTIPRESVIGWREPPPKTCKLGKHPIDEVVDRGLVTFWSISVDRCAADIEAETVETRTYACFECAKNDEIRAFRDTGIVRTSLWTDASMREHEYEYIMQHVASADQRETDNVQRYAKLLARRIGKEQAAYGSTLPPEVASAVAAINAGAVDEHTIRDAFCGPYDRFWFHRLCAQMEPVRNISKVWEREVWFGGEDRSQDDRYTEPYSENMPEYRAYLHKEGGGIRPDVLPPGSLQAFVIPAKYHGYKAVVGDVSYLSYSMAGRHMFQIERADSVVVAISDETSPEARSGIQGIAARGEEAVALFMRAIDDWKAGRIHLEHDRNVGII